MTIRRPWWQVVQAKTEKAIFSVLFTPAWVVLGVGVLLWDKLTSEPEGRYD